LSSSKQIFEKTEEDLRQELISLLKRLRELNKEQPEKKFESVQVCREMWEISRELRRRNIERILGIATKCGACETFVDGLKFELEIEGFITIHSVEVLCGDCEELCDFEPTIFMERVEGGEVE